MRQVTLEPRECFVSPRQNALIERFSSRRCQECLNREAFIYLREAMVVIAVCWRFYRDGRFMADLIAAE